MYENYWNLSRKPFDNGYHADFYFAAECHQGALLKLRYAVEHRRGAALLAGAAGLGKTYLTTRLLESMDDHVHPRVHLVFPDMKTDQFIAYLASCLTGEQISQANTPVHFSIKSMQESLAENSSQGKHAVVCVDESHLIQQRSALEALRMLLNFQSQDGYDLTLLLVGQTGVIPTVVRHAGFNDRLTVKCLLRPFDAVETEEYIQHRLNVAGGDASIFTNDAIRGVYEHSHGYPSRINRLCDLALLVGFAEEQKFVDGLQIAEVANEIVAIGESNAA